MLQNMLRTKRLIILHILFLSSLHLLFGQATVMSDHQTDSIRKVVDQNTKANNSENLNLLVLYVLQFDEDSAKVIANKALEDAEAHNDDLQLGYAYKNLGYLYQLSNNYDTAFTYFKNAEKIFLKIDEKAGLLEVYNNLALLHKNTNQLDMALDQLMKMQKLISSMEEVTPISKTVLYSNLAGIYYLKGQNVLGMQYLDSVSQYINQFDNVYVKGKVYNNLGKFFSEIERYDKALSMLKRSREIYEELGDASMLAMIYGNLGEVYEKIYNYQRAENYYRQSLNSYKSQGDSLGIANVKEHLGVILTLRRDFKASRVLLEEAYSIFDSFNDGPGMGQVTISIANSYLQQENYSMVIEYLDNNMEIIVNANRRNLLEDYYKLRMNGFKALNRYADALVATEKYHAIQDSIQETRHRANLKIMKQELSLSKYMLQNQLSLKEKKAESTAPLSPLWLYVAIVLLIIVAGFAVISIRNEKQRNKALNQQLAEKEKQVAAMNQKALDFKQQVKEEVEQRTQDYEEQIKQFKKKDNKLKKSLKEVEDANYLKNAFLSNMSHEIRTPLNGIIGFASLLETELSLLENEELYGYANGIQQSGERLLHLLNNIIDISRIEANDLQVSLQETNLNQIIDKSAELFKFQANEKSLALNIRLEETPMIYADPDSVSKILSDIIDNAVKYTEKGFINVTNGYLSDKKEVFVKVKDTGIGIDETYLPKVFEAFRQESLGYSRAFQGAGLGLPLAKRLLDLLSGRIEIESKKQEGTIVTVYLPTKETFKHVNESLHPQKKKGKEPIPLKKAIEDTHLFLVEDDRMNRLVITKMLTDWNLQSAEDGDITIEKIEAAYKKGKIFDLMLFDINLPNPWDGIKLMHYVKKKFPEYENVPFIAQTAYAMRGDKERLLEEGFDDYLSKPISQQRLLTAIYKFLRKQEEL